MDVLPQYTVNSSTRARPGHSWHPKITPYRMAIILTTLSLGTAKAVLTQQGRSVAPITLEWISGVVLVLTFQICSEYDMEGRAPQSLSWFFTFDCMDVIWDILFLFSIRRPSYISDELRSLPHRNSGHPPITLYRIALNLMILLFGISKATLSYLGSSEAVTWLDWSLGTLLTTRFYVLGLYEYNTSNICAAFFAQDRTDYVTPVMTVLFIIFMICLIFFEEHMLWTSTDLGLTGLSISTA